MVRKVKEAGAFFQEAANLSKRHGEECNCLLDLHIYTVPASSCLTAGRCISDNREQKKIFFKIILQVKYCSFGT
jgi:hypothetical protein